MADENLQQKLKNHIRFEEGVMDDNTMSVYIESAKRYVRKKTGHEIDYLTIMVATIMYDNRSASEDLQKALQSLEMVFALEVLTDGEGEPSPNDQPTSVQG